MKDVRFFTLQNNALYELEICEKALHVKAFLKFDAPTIGHRKGE